MLFSTQTDYLAYYLGLDKAIEVLIDAGYPALDLSMFHTDRLFVDGWEDQARRLRAYADERGVVFNQAHAPFGGGYDNYVGKLIPMMPMAFKYASILGVKQMIVHPLQRGRYLGHEKELFDLNMDFYRSLIPLSEETGIRIALENMWQTHPVTHRVCDDVCADPHELAAYFDTLDDPKHFTVCLDIGHVAICGREPADAIRILGHDRLGALHVHDVDYVGDLHILPGTSRIHWNGVLRALADIDYNGEFTLEADNFFAGFDREYWPTVARFMADTARFMRDKLVTMKEEKN